MKSNKGTKVLLCGYFGENNLGDDALMTILVNELPSNCNLTIMVNDYELTTHLAPKASLVKRKSIRDIYSSIQSTDLIIWVEEVYYRIAQVFLV